MIGDPLDVDYNLRMPSRTHIPMNQIRAFCEKWSVAEFSLFGSVLRDDFRPDSDIDCLVTFEATARWDLWDIIDMRDELKAMFGREVDIIERAALRNPHRRKAILSSAERIYG